MSRNQVQIFITFFVLLYRKIRMGVAGVHCLILAIPIWEENFLNALTCIFSLVYCLLYYRNSIDQSYKTFKKN